MTQNDLLRAFDGVDDDMLQRSETGARRTRRLPALLVAAAVTLGLMGAAAAADAGGIQGWLSGFWRETTGLEMTEGHEAAVESLCAALGESVEADGVTVTADSAAVGMDCFFLLLRVEGPELSEESAYGFAGVDLRVEPDPLDSAGGQWGYGVQSLGVDGGGAALLLLQYDFLTQDGFPSEARPMTVSLTLTDFARDPFSDGRTVLAAGPWTLTLTFDGDALAYKPLGDAQITMEVAVPGAQPRTAVAQVRDVRLTAMGLYFLLESDDEDALPAMDDVTAVLDGGAVVRCRSGGGVWLDDGTVLFSFPWLVPVDPAEVRLVRICDAALSVP